MGKKKDCCLSFVTTEPCDDCALTKKERKKHLKKLRKQLKKQLKGQK
jgi:hypothetical protein